MPQLPLSGSGPYYPGTSLQDEDEQPTARSYVCDGCGARIAGVPESSGLLLWTRGDEVRYEEPPLCPECSSQVVAGALLRLSDLGGEEG